MRTQAELNRFLVCGLGSLGQHCVAVLKQYGATVIAIDRVPPQDWEISDLPNLLEELVIGDCRLSSILEQARIRQCRAVLLLTGSERVNTEAALAARLLNPQIRPLVRSDKQRLNRLLGQNLGNFAAFEPNQLSASAFALAALGAETIGYFNLDGQLFKVAKHQIQPGDAWSACRQVQALNTRIRRILSHTSASSRPPTQFHEWEPETLVQEGDTLVYVEVVDRLSDNPQPSTAKVAPTPQRFWDRLLRSVRPRHLTHKWHKFLQSNYYSQNRVQRIATIYCFTVFVLWLCGVVLYQLNYPGISTIEALYAPAVLLLGGYGDLFGSVKFASQPAPAEHMPMWLRLFSFGLTLTGEAFVGVLYALITDSLLSSRLKFLTRRPPIPESNHVVLIGIGPLGQRVAALLQELKQPVVGISRTEVELDSLPQIPLVISRIVDALAKVNLANAKTVIVTMDDDLENLEIGLMAHAADPTTNLVLQTYDQRFSNYVARMFPYARVLCSSALSAEVFAAAAFGENILSLFHFYHQTVLVTEYRIEAGDTLNGLMLSEVAYGYGVIPILHQKSNYELPKFMPSYETRLSGGERLIVLATSLSLQHIERGKLAPRDWQLRIEAALTPEAIFEGAHEIAQMTGCSIGTARHLMHHLPGLLPHRLYNHQAQHLVHKLSRVKVKAHSIALTNTSQ
ncbi:MAG: potassium channel protein [Chroococcidiopsidaceae cyanobacterium CP_BM_ER_R8_30]|nr:potassium channel protein [Chroococcidiopsidaceae cyanobacterium CP_BM_ER_R8_30]